MEWDGHTMECQAFYSNDLPAGRLHVSLANQEAPLIRGLSISSQKYILIYLLRTYTMLLE